MTAITDPALRFLDGGGDMGARIRAFDWTRTPLGAPARWPQSLRTAVSILLDTPFPMLLAWGDGFTQFYNDGYRPILGSTKHPAALGSSTPATFPEIWSDIRPMFAEARAGRPTTVVDLMLPLHRHGCLDDCYFTFSYSPVREEGGSVGGVLVTVTETTERVLAARRLITLHQAAAALREGEARFRQMADHAPMMVWVTEPDGSCSFLSRSWYEFTGQDSGRGVVDGWADAVHPEDVTRVRDIFFAANRDRAPYRQEFRLRRADGAYRWAIGAAVPHFAADGAFLGYIGSVIDITERKEIEERQHQALDAERAARAELERVNRTKDEFLATVSHELRTPLHAIMSWSDLLREGHLAPSEIAEALSAIGRNARLQSRLIEDLLDMSRVISGDVRLNLRLVSLADAIGVALQSFHPATAAKRIRVVRNFEIGDAVVTGDAERLQQIFSNLLGNAVKFTPAGGRIDISVRRVRTRVEVRIADTGDGIDPDFLPHVFERLRQGDGTASRVHGGLGIGLSIVSQLVELHKGTMSAASPGRGKGSTFTVALPLAMAKREPVRRERTALNTRPRFRGRRILIVDDDGDALAIARRILLNYEAEVTVADSGREALAALEASPFDLLISDIGMPEIDGYDLIRRIRAMAPERGGGVLAIAVTAYARPDDRARALQAGFQRHIAKPIRQAELVKVCAGLLGEPL